MKPDWQNKSFAKTGSPAAPSTMNPKLKVGMSTLHSKISQANNNMPQAPKPVVRKFADGGSVRTRSDDEIGDTDPRTGVVNPGSYDRRMKAGEENLNRLKSAVESVRSFFSRDKEPASSPSNITGDSGMSDSDVAKKQSMSNMSFDKKEEPKAEVKAEEPRRKIEDYIKSAPVVESTTSSQNLPAAAPAAAASSNAASPNAASSNAASSNAASSNAASSNDAAAAAAAKKAAAAAKKAAEKKAAEKKKKQANANANSASDAASPSSSNVAKSFSEDVAKRRAANMQPLSSSTAMFSDTMKSPPVPKDNRPKTDMKTTLQKGADAVSNYFSNFETPMQRRERERKEAKK